MIILNTTKDTFDYIDIFLDPVIAVVTFILGIWVSNYFTNKKEKNKLKETIEYFDLYYKDQKLSIQDQVRALEQLEKDLGSLTNTNGLAYPKVMQPFTILETINKETLLNAWTNIKARDPKALVNILKFIEYIKVLFNFHEDFHERFLISQNDLRIKWQNSINEFMVLKGKMLEKTKEEIIKDQTLSVFNNICNNWLTSEDIMMFKVTITHLVEPVLNLYGPIYQQTPDDKKIYEIILHVQKIKAIYSEWEIDIANYRKGINGNVKKVTEKLSELKEK